MAKVNRLQKLIVLRGLPGSGKSTKAKELLSENRFAVRVNKDTLREMFHMGGYEPRDEHIVVELEYKLVRDLLGAGKDVIVDDTNFNQKHIDTYQNIAGSHGAGLEIVFINTPIEECIKRDAARKLEGKANVGADNIKNMAFQFGLLKQETPCIVSDLDGTITNLDHRLKYVQGEHKDWDKFFETCGRDLPRQDVIDLITEYKRQGYDVIICSARPEDHRETTEWWLATFNVPYDRLIMRRHADFRQDEIVKVEFVTRYLDKSKIVTWLDDRPKVIRALRLHGIPVVDVGMGKEF